MTKALFFAGCVLFASGCASERTVEPRSPASDGKAIGFDRESVGALPAGWQVGTTKPSGPDATWIVRADSSAPTSPNVLSLSSTNHGGQDAFNLCWNSKLEFREGMIEVAFLSEAGEVDQGGGIAWRVQGPNDYYLCRYNPLESNLRAYVVKGGVRTQLDTESARIAGGWHRIRIEHAGDRITCWLDGSEMLEAHDSALPDPGGVGVWTKADARTSFDDLLVASVEK